MKIRAPWLTALRGESRHLGGRRGASIAALFSFGRLLPGESLVLKPGCGVVTWALDPKRTVALLLAVLVLRCGATRAAVAGGGVGVGGRAVGGCGAVVGRAFGQAFAALDDSLFLVLGMAAFLGAGYRVPLAAVIFVAESTGRLGFVVPALMAAVVAELVMGDASVTADQVALRHD